MCRRGLPSFLPAIPLPRTMSCFSVYPFRKPSAPIYWRASTEPLADQTTRPGEVHLSRITALEFRDHAPGILKLLCLQIADDPADRLGTGRIIELRRQKPLDHADLVRFPSGQLKLAAFLIAPR